LDVVQMSDNAMALGNQSDGSHVVVELLDVNDLTVKFQTTDGVVVTVLNHISLTLKRHETVVVVGESGSGKSTLALAIVGLLAPNAQVTGSIVAEGLDLLNCSVHELREFRRQRLGFIFQDALTALSPVFRVRNLIAERMQVGLGLSRTDARDAVTAALQSVGIDEVERVGSSYPSQLSGGLRQRVLIALALAVDPVIVIADEPTTALDVIVQQEVLLTLKRLQHKLRGGMLFITHDLDVAGYIGDRIVVMYGGTVMEVGPTREILSKPKHPYTRALINSMPRMIDRKKPLSVIHGDPVKLSSRRIVGCAFAPRCDLVMDICRKEAPPLAEIKHGEFAACFAIDSTGAKDLT
jgi:oligopeptide/dipeptide ABC transporter ATP-binding protein